MTRQNKAIQKKIIARQFTALHLQGQKGPAQTKPAHGKVNTDKAARLAKLAATLAAAAQGAKAPAKGPAGGKGSKYAQKKG